MSMESAKAYIERMRADEQFRQAVNALSEDEDKSWAFVQAQGYDFTMQDFRAAQEKIYEEYGIEPM
jgi:predicted ribosomally synthesized peptide with nif11-like leader